MKKIFTSLLLFAAYHSGLIAQTNAKYPTPEFSNEIYFFKKDSIQAMRLEKGYSKMEMKTKMGGMGGGQSGYTLEGSKSPVRLHSGELSFIFFGGEASGSAPSASDSFMKANGMDPSSMGDPMAMMNDPSKTTSLYKMNVEKGDRKITIQAYQGMKILGKSTKESTKYTLSIRKVRQGYYELIVDKPLEKGEYAFLVTDAGSMDGSYKLFAFGID
jgi:hypothetical protein